MLWMRPARPTRRATPLAESAFTVVLTFGGVGAITLAGSRVEPLSLIVACLVAAVVTVALQRWGGRVTALIALGFALALTALQPFGDLVRDVWFGAAAGSGCAAGVHGLVHAHGPGRWQAGLLAQLALIAIGVQLAYRDRAPLLVLAWPWADKALHALLIGAAAYWLNLLWRGRRLAIGRFRIPAAIVIPLAAAALEETIQGLAPWRSLDGLDLLADALGLMGFWLLSEGVLRLAARRAPLTEAGG